jgi:hypothetical protein
MDAGPSPSDPTAADEVQLELALPLSVEAALAAGCLRALPPFTSTAAWSEPTGPSIARFRVAGGVASLLAQAIRMTADSEGETMFMVSPEGLVAFREEAGFRVWARAPVEQHPDYQGAYGFAMAAEVFQWLGGDRPRLKELNPVNQWDDGAESASSKRRRPKIFDPDRPIEFEVLADHLCVRSDSGLIRLTSTSCAVSREITQLVYPSTPGPARKFYPSRLQAALGWAASISGSGVRDGDSGHVEVSDSWAEGGHKRAVALYRSLRLDGLEFRIRRAAAAPMRSLLNRLDASHSCWRVDGDELSMSDGEVGFAVRIEPPRRPGFRDRLPAARCFRTVVSEAELARALILVAIAIPERAAAGQPDVFIDFEVDRDEGRLRLSCRTVSSGVKASLAAAFTDEASDGGPLTWRVSGTHLARTALQPFAGRALDQVRAEEAVLELMGEAGDPTGMIVTVKRGDAEAVLVFALAR